MQSFVLEVVTRKIDSHQNQKDYPLGLMKCSEEIIYISFQRPGHSWMLAIETLLFFFEGEIHVTWKWRERLNVGDSRQQNRVLICSLILLPASGAATFWTTKRHSHHPAMTIAITERTHYCNGHLALK